MKKFKKVLGMLTLVMSLLVASVVSAQEVKNEVVENEVVEVVEVIPVDSLSYARIYENKVEYIEFDNELECADAYSNDWYDIHGENEIELVNTNISDDDKMTLEYNDGTVTECNFNDELITSEIYSNVVYHIEENELLDVIPVNNNTYMELYANKVAYIEFNSELECVEAYSNAWYDLHNENDKITNVGISNDEKNITVSYNHGNNIEIQLDNSLDGAETYTLIYDSIHGI